MSQSAYQELSATWKRLHHFGHLQALAGWDRMAMMPTSGNDARSNAMAEMDGLLHSIRTNPQLKVFLDHAEREALDDAQRANLREIRRDWRTANALPAALVQKQSLANAKCEHAWRTQRPANDWPGFLTNFRQVLKCSREQATFLSNQSGLKPYDALMDYYEPGMTSEKLDVLFGDLLTWLPDLVRKVRVKQAQQNVIAPKGPLTTRYREDDFVGSLMGTIHETGHGRYEQNLPRNLLGQPVAWARSAGIHESQSLSFEMQIGLSRAFVGLIVPHIVKQFGAQPAFDPDNLYQHLIRVQPSFIRVDADELTYPLHVILRYRIERDLIEGRIEADDIPALWDAAMADFLDVDTRGNYTNGCMQDVHWGEGLFGYFPSYTLGAMYAAQWFAAIRRAVPDLDTQMAAGNLAPALEWLKTNVWEQGSRWTTDELVTRATGSALDPVHYRRHLESRYLA